MGRGENCNEHLPTNMNDPTNFWPCIEEIHMTSVVRKRHRQELCHYNRLFFCPFQKNSGPKNSKNLRPQKNLKGHFEQKTQCVGVNLRFQLKTLKF